MITAVTNLHAHSYDRKPANAGFTIIEMLIVLAIAGLILMIVFLAIPSLERNSRNNQRVEDVQTILGAVSHWELNNSGNVPNTSATPPDNFLQNYTSRLTYYDPVTGVTSMTLTPGGNPPASPPDIEKVYVYNYEKCDATVLSGYTSQGAGYNDVVALYAIETGSGGIAPKCQQI